MGRIDAVRKFCGSALALCVASLIGCPSHYGIEVIAETRGPSAIAMRTPVEVEAVIEIVDRIAGELGMSRREPPDLAGSGEMLTLYTGPWSNGHWQHPAGRMEISVWRNEDGSASVWIVDWGQLGLSERLQSLRDRVKAALEERFPEHEIRIEVQKLGFWSP